MAMTWFVGKLFYRAVRVQPFCAFSHEVLASYYRAGNSVCLSIEMVTIGAVHHRLDGNLSLYPHSVPPLPTSRSASPNGPVLYRDQYSAHDVLPLFIKFFLLKE